MSPDGKYMAVLTNHTVHIAVLPDPSHLTADDTSIMRLKTFTLGPTTHVTTQSAVASALWHPLGVNGQCIVTVTEDAVVRVWELSVTDRWSFDKPTLAIDLKRLADGVTADQDFGPSVSGRSNGFSPDSFEMEVASACFGGRGSGEWSPMTLWIAMREGDVYALCPLLPEKWSPPSTLVPSLSCSIVAKVAAMEDDINVPEHTQLLSQQQLQWMSDLDNQDPLPGEALPGEYPGDIYTRPAKPGRIPRLQGPFDLELGPDEDDERETLLSDIFVIGAKVDGDELMLGEDDELELEEAEQEGLSIGVVCLLTSSGRIIVCLDSDGVEAQWLPTRNSAMRGRKDDADYPALLTYQVVETLRPREVNEESWPMFSPDVTSRYSFFVTHTSSVTFISLSPWIFRLESELQGKGEIGANLRIDLLATAQSSTRERLITHHSSSDPQPYPLAASTLIRDPDLGYFLLTATAHEALALSLEVPDAQYRARHFSSGSETSETDQPLLLCAPRPVYQPPHAFEANSAAPSLLSRLRHSKYKRLIQEPIRLSPATLNVMTDAHTVLGDETHRLSTAAAELFRRCEQLQVDLREQIARANEVASRVEAVVGDDVEDQNTPGGNEGLELRIKRAEGRQKELTERLDKMRKKITKNMNRPLSDKEAAWVAEVGTLSPAVLKETPESSSSVSDHALSTRRRRNPAGQSKQPWLRYQEVQELKEELLESARRVVDAEEATVEGRTQRERIRVPVDVRRMKVAEVWGLLDRETALVEAARARLEKMSMI